MGLVYEQQHNWEAAIKYHTQAIAIHPNYTKAHYRLGLIYRRQQQFTPAIGKFSQVLALDPSHQGAKFNLALIYEQENVDVIANLLEPSDLELLPKLTNHINNTGTDLVNQGKLKEAQKCFEYVIELDPEATLAYYNLGCIFQNDKYYLEAIYYYNRAVEINPEYIGALKNLSYVYYQNGQPNLAQECIEKVLKKTPHRPLRIGYISPDFRRHSVSAFIKPVIQHHDRSRVEVFCYGEVSKPDGITEEIINICDTWRCTVGMTDIEVAELIKSHHPDDAQAYYRLGLAYVASNDVERAVSAYLQSLTLDRSCAVTYQALAQLLKEQELIEEAEKYHRYASLLSISH